MNIVEIIGYIAAICTTIAYIPQTIRVVKTKSTKDISLGMFSLLTVGVGMWVVYGICINKGPLIISNIICLVFILTILGYKIRYK